MTDAQQETAPQAACPACGKPTRYSTANPFRPFCTERCKVMDLGAWASEQYRIAGNPQDNPPEETDLQ